MTKEENIEQLVSQLSDTGFHKPNMYSYLEDCWGMDIIPHYQRERIGDDEMSYQLTIKRDGASGLYYPEGYEATLLKTHPVPHGHFNDIDTQKLEQRLKEVNWNEYIPKSTRQDDKAFRVILDVVDLAVWQNKEAQDISRRLQLRYWLHTPVEQDLNVAQYISHYQRSHYFPLNNGFADIHAREGYNLLSGRSVLKFYQLKDDPQTILTHWKTLVDGEMKTFPPYDFMTILKALSVEDEKNSNMGPQLIYDIMRGERVNAHLNKDDMACISVFIEADPHHRTINLYNADLAKLNIREHLPMTNEDLDNFKKQNALKITHKKTNRKNKGRSL